MNTDMIIFEFGSVEGFCNHWDSASLFRHTGLLRKHDLKIMYLENGRNKTKVIMK